MTRRLADWWLRRWLAGRARRPEVLAEVERHTLVRPVTHGARVPTLPEDDGTLFASLSRD